MSYRAAVAWVPSLPRHGVLTTALPGVGSDPRGEKPCVGLC